MTNKPKWKAYRKAKQLTMRQVCEACGVTHTTLARVEEGLQEPSEFMRHRMMKLYGIKQD